MSAAIRASVCDTKVRRAASSIILSCDGVRIGPEYPEIGGVGGRMRSKFAVSALVVRELPAFTL